MALCKDYLTVGVAAIRKWLGLEGSGGLATRDGACAAAALSALKAFVSWATRPRPAQVGAPPAGLPSCEASFRGASAPPISGKDRRGLVQM